MTTTTALITKTYTNGAVFVFREDGWFNMTKAAKAFGKEAKEFLRLPSTQAYVGALKEVGISHVCTAKVGWHLNADSGTWAHPKLAVFFARWLDVRFAVWCDSVIEDILKGNVLIATPAQEKAETVLKGLGYTYLEGTGEWRAPAGQLQGPGKLLIRSPKNPPQISEGASDSAPCRFTPRAPGRPPMAAPAGASARNEGRPWAGRLSAAARLAGTGQCPCPRNTGSRGSPTLPLVGPPGAGPQDTPPRPSLLEQL